MSQSASEADRARGILSTAVVLFRWAALVWMVALAATVQGGFRNTAFAWAGIGAAGAWTVWMSVARRERSAGSLLFELGLALALIVIAGVVEPRGAVVTSRPFYATAWPVAAVAGWGIARGPAGGVLSAFVVGIALFASRAVNGIAPGELSGTQIEALANGTVTYMLAGGAVGFVSRLFERSAEQVGALLEESMRARERAARAAERESIARQIHDSVLQALAMVHKRGRELATAPQVSGAEVGALAEMAGTQEAELRALILREPQEPPSGQASLRQLLEQTARSHGGVPVTVSAVGPIWMGAHAATEVVDAVRQALDNVDEHATATRATIFADCVGGWVTVSVRDDGGGFVYDEEQLKADGKAGLLKSMKGRVEAIGGRMHVHSAPGSGTEIELRVPEGEEPR